MFYKICSCYPNSKIFRTFALAKKRIISFSQPLISSTNPTVKLMEKRLGIIAIVIYSKQQVEEVNRLISLHNDIVVARQGIPMPQDGLSFISLVVKAPMNQINTLTGKLGRLEAIEVKTIITKNI